VPSFIPLIIIPLNTSNYDTHLFTKNSKAKLSVFHKNEEKYIAQSGCRRR